MNEFNEKNMAEHKPWKKAMCVLLSVIIAFGTLITLTVGSSRLQDWLGIKSMLSAYAAEIVDTTGAVAVDEESMLADNNVIDLENSDGSNTIYLFSEPISFTDENGNLKTKDISVEKQSDRELKKQGYEYTNGQNDYRINFSEDINQGLLIESGSCTYSIIPQTEYKSAQGKENVSEYLGDTFETFEYSGAFGAGTSLKFYPQLNGIKDEIVLNQNIDKTDFSFELKTENCTASLNDDGTVTLVNANGENVQTFSAPFAYDSEYVEGIYDEHYSGCTYTLEQTGTGTYILSVHVDADWLNSSDTVYPVVIDPTTSHIGNMYDLPIHTKRTTTGATVDNNAVGTSTEMGTSRSLIKFQKPSEIKAYAKINSAYYWTRELTGRTSAFKCGVYKITSSWNEKSLWTTRPTYNGTMITSRNINSASKDYEPSPYWYKFNITSLVQQWYTGTTNYGFMMKYENESASAKNLRTFAQEEYSSSAWRPYTVINYTNDATAPTVTSVTGNATSWTSSNVTLTVNGAKDNSGGVGMHSTPYSFSTTKGSYSWQASKSKTFSSNCTVYVYVRDAWNNIRLVSTQTISKIDKSAPTYTSVTGNAASWTNSNVTLKVNGATDAASGLHSTAYSFTTTSGSYSWQSGNTKTVSSNGTYYIYIRDATGNIRSAGSVNVSKIDKTSPVISDITVQKDSETKQTTVTITASDSLSGIAGYSFDGGTTWQTANSKALDSVPNTISVAVKDNAGNITTDISDTILPEFYEEGALIGIYNPNTDSSETMQYKIGEDGEWTDYSVPFAVPLEGSVNVYAKLSSSKSAVCHNFTSSADNYIGLYNETATDLTVSYKNISFDIARTYNSGDNNWIFSTNSKIETTDKDYIIHALLPDFSELTFIKQDNNTYINEVSGQKLTVIRSEDNSVINGYSVTIDDLTYNYNADGVLVSVSDAFGNSIHFSYNNGKLEKIYYGTDEIREYIISSDDNGMLKSIVTPLGEKIVYSYENGQLTDVYYDKDTLVVSRDSNIVLGHYEYSQNKMSESNNTTIEYSDGKLTKITLLTGEVHDYSFELTEEDFAETVYKVSETTADGTVVTYYNSALSIIKTIDADDIISEYEYDDCQNLISKISDGEETTYTYVDNVLTQCVGSGVTTTYEDGKIVSEESDESNTIYSYNSDGKLLSVTTTATLDNENGETPESIVTYSLTNEYDNGILKKGTEYTFDSENGDTTTTVTTYNTDETIASTSVTTVTKTESAEEFTDTETSSYTYDSFGNVAVYQTISHDSDDTETVGSSVYTYDLLDRNTEVSTPSGEIQQEYIYDPLGNVIYEKASDSETRTIYDDYSRVVQKITDEDYDPDLDGLKSVNPADSYSDASAGNTYVYAENGNLASETNRLGVTTYYTYFDNSSTVKKESFDLYVYEYDTDGNVVSVTVSGNLYASYSYDGDLLQQIDYGNGQSVIYEYNEFGQTLSQKYKASENAETVTQFEYNYTVGAESEDESELLSKIDYSTNQITEYDGNKVTISNIVGTDDDGDYIKELYHSYEETEEVENDDNTTTPASFTETFSDTSLKVTYNDDSNVFVRDDQEIFSYHYQSDENENLASESITSKVDGVEKTLLNTTYEYNEKGYVTKMTTEYKNGKIVSTYVYDDKGRVIEYHPDENSVGYFTYDSKGQLIREDFKYNLAEYTMVYTYDSRGNVTSTRSYPYTRGEITQSEVTSYRYDFEYENDIWLDEMSEIDDCPILYDSQGNPVELGDCKLNWTNGRQLDSVSYVNEDGIEETIISYTYDEKGIRTSKTYAGATTYYTSVDGRITSQYQIDENGAKSEEIIFMYNGDGELVGANYGGYDFYYIKNAMGDIIGFIDELENTVSVNYYTAWGINISGIHNTKDGKIPSSTAASRFDKKALFGYKGYYCDDESNYYYLQSRYYIADWCRFMNADLPEYAQLQKDEPTGTNLFAYCCNDPVNNLDDAGYWKAALHNGYKGKYKYYSVSTKSKKYYYGTYYWAIKCGFKESDAKFLGECCNFLDKKYSSTMYAKALAANAATGEQVYSTKQLNEYKSWQYWHFNKYKSGYSDSRREFAYNRRKKAVQNWKRDKKYALRLLAYGLHAIQDISAHGQIGRGKSIPQHIVLSRSNKNLFNHADKVQGYMWSNSSRNGLLYIKGSVTRLLEAQRDTYNYLNGFISAIGGKSKLK